MALALTQKVIFTMRDVGGKTGTTSLRTPMAAGDDPITTLAGYVTALNAASKCKVVSEVGQTADNGIIGTEAENNYDVRDKLAIEYVDQQNAHHVIHVADPDPAIFDPDNFELVDELSGDWDDAKTAIETNVVGKDGQNVKVIRGYRDRSRNLRSSMKFQP